MNNILTTSEKERYNRQIILPDFGEEAQSKLKAAKVLVVGLGGLGSVASLYLTAAGFGTIGIMDDDTVAIHNLQRQILYREDEVGESKAQRAEATLQRLNHNVNLVTYNHRLTAENAEQIVSQYDLVLDCTDNYAARYLINDTCVKCDKPFVYGTIGDTKGQLAVFNYQPPATNYRTLYPNQEALEAQGNLNKGVMGVLPAVIASLQVNEAVKIVTGVGTPLKDTLFMIDLMTNETLKFKLKVES